ncbi:MAG: hypothetical protein RL758_1757, partial [Pseudomonadota bacterium]
CPPPPGGCGGLPGGAAPPPPLGRRIAMFVLVAALSLVVTFYTMSKSKRLSDFLDVLSDERATLWQKCLALGLVWKK